MEPRNVLGGAGLEVYVSRSCEFHRLVHNVNCLISAEPEQSTRSSIFFCLFTWRATMPFMWLDAPLHIRSYCEYPMSGSNQGQPGSDPDSDTYLLGTVDKALSVLEIIEAAGAMNIQEVAAATGIQRSAVFRLLYTLEKRGYVERLPNKRYRSAYRQRRIRLGYAAPLSGTAFRSDLAASVQRAAKTRNVELIVLDNLEGDPDASVRNAQALVDAKVNAAMIFQTDAAIGHVVADIFLNAYTPLISIEHPIQGAVYFGANNYQAGKLAGRVLGSFARENWQARFDGLVLLESASTGSAVQARLAGVLAGVKEILGYVGDSQVVHLESHVHEETSRQAMAELLASIPQGARLLISGFNDPIAVGALQAVRAAGREMNVAVVGQNATRESRDEIRNPTSRFIASIAYFPERYGSKLINLAFSIDSRMPVAPAVYTEHVVVDRYNISKYYEPRCE